MIYIRSIFRNLQNVSDKEAVLLELLTIGRIPQSWSEARVFGCLTESDVLEDRYRQDYSAAESLMDFDEVRRRHIMTNNSYTIDILSFGPSSPDAYSVVLLDTVTGPRRRYLKYHLGVLRDRLERRPHRGTQ